MPFERMQPRKYPVRHWAVAGPPGSGKSTLATRMRGSLLPIDADHRWHQVLGLNNDCWEFSHDPADNVETDRIERQLRTNMQTAKVGTIIVDSLTAIITPHVVQAMIDKSKGLIDNLAAAMQAKALAMRQLQDAVTRWGTDVLWIWHTQEGRDAKGREQETETLSPTERVRLTRSLNVILRVEINGGGRRGVRVVWCRHGRSGAVVWDDSGSWLGMPERLEAAMYDGLTVEEKRAIENPTVFATPELAIAWGVEQGCFKAIEHARNAYAKLKEDHKPRTAVEMAALWVNDVRRRVAEGPQEESHGN